MGSWLPINIKLSDLTLRGCRSGQGQARKVLCIHGWLDNANSFYGLQSHLDGCDLVALDLPGHGQSDHFSNAVPYTIAGTMHYVLQAAQALGWHKFDLVGHSLGGGIAPLCASAVPHAIESLVLIDALGAVSEEAEKLPARLSRYHREMKSHTIFKPRPIESLQHAADIRLKATKMQHSSALCIAERQLTETDTGWQWSFDNKLRVASPSYFSEDQILSVLRSIQCPVLCIIAEQGYQTNSAVLDTRCKTINRLQLVHLPGNHHLHMDNPAPVAEKITQFWQDTH